MITDVLTNATAKAAIEALQKGDRKAWSALFEPDAKLYDDGSPRPLQKFTDDALGHERFTSIERVENHGLDVIGAFHSDTWGDFRTYFRFRLSRQARSTVLTLGRPDSAIISSASRATRRRRQVAATSFAPSPDPLRSRIFRSPRSGASRRPSRPCGCRPC
jgi:hypothetical protein